MKSFRLNSPARFLTAALLMISWFIATNHCAFGLMKPTVQAKSEHSHCHGGAPVSGKDAPKDNTRDCCQSIQGAPAPDKVEAKFDATQLQLQLFVWAQMLLPATTERELSWFVFDHGPPRVVSFAESVLQRGLRSHAPPITV